ncbi:TolC family protein [Thiohalorhabdus sp. Cl-TMA]|uniref:TolC family protein n=1 Tax=Thiohalorhabdus methylotrophus TaxID=3242694 RepID=A0ABV4TYC2_9GAMM
MPKPHWSPPSVRRNGTAFITLLLLGVGSAWGTAPSGDGSTPGQGPYVPLPTDPGLGLGEVVQRATERFPEGNQPQARQSQAQALKSRSSAFLPANPAIGVTHYNDTLLTGNGNREWEAGMEIPIWRPGQREARGEYARRTSALANATQGSIRLRAAGAVRSRLWALGLQRNRVALARRELKTAKALAEKVRRRMELGDLARTDLLLARERVLEKETVLEEQQGRLRVLRADYRRVSGLDRVPETWRESPVDEPPFPAEHPTLARAEQEVARLRAKVRWAGKEATANPSLTLGARRERAADGTAINGVVAAVHIPIGLSTQREAKQAPVRMELARAQSRLDRLRREVTGTREEARQGIVTARRTLRQARKRERLARHNLKLARKAFDAGEYDLIDLIKVQDKFAAARRDRARRELELHRAIARFNQAAGVIPWPRSAQS